MSERPSTYEISPQVPGRIGRWLGWKIVSSYMDQNQITLEELLLEVDFKKYFITQITSQPSHVKIRKGYFHDINS